MKQGFQSLFKIFIILVVMVCTCGLADARPTLTNGVKAPLTRDETQNINIYKKASPAVVNITSTTLALDIFLNVIPQRGMGSGSILTDDGYILTNAHVVVDKAKLEVTLLNGRNYKAKLVGIDNVQDIALIKIEPEPGQKFPVIKMGNSDHLDIGQNVYAIGNPFGLGSTLTTGVISSVRKRMKVQARYINNVIQTDAAINPGNSGGPLLDSAGNLIGVNTAIFSPSGASAGIGFAIPVNTVNRIVNDIIMYGRVIRPYLGFHVSIELNPNLSRVLNLPVDRGLMVGQINRNSPAYRAGLKESNRILRVGNRRYLLGGDIIVGVDDKIVVRANDFVNYIQSKEVGDKISLRVVRGSQVEEVVILLSERPIGGG